MYLRPYGATALALVVYTAACFAEGVIRLDFGPKGGDVEPGCAAITPETLATAQTPGWAARTTAVGHRTPGLVSLKIKPNTPPAGPLFSDFIYGAEPAELVVPVGAAKSCEVLFVTGYADGKKPSDGKVIEVDYDYTLNANVKGRVYVYPAADGSRLALYSRRHTVQTPEGVLRLSMKPKTFWSLVCMIVVPEGQLTGQVDKELAALAWSARMLPKSPSYELAPDPDVPFAGEPLETTADEKKTGAVFFTRPWYLPVEPNAIPGRAEVGKPARAFAAKGEIEPVAVAVHLLRDCAKVEFKLEPLKTDSGVALPAAAVTLWQVVDVPVNTGVQVRQDEVAVLSWRETPLCVRPLTGPLDMKAGRNARLWIVAKAPKDQKEGIYKGAVEARAEGNLVCRVPVFFRVLPYALEENPNLAVNMYYRDNVKKEIEYPDLAAHRVNSITLRSIPKRPKDAKPGEEVWDFSALEKDVELLNRCGLNGPHPWLVGTTFGVFTVSGDRKEIAYTPEKEKLVDGFCRQLAAFLAQKKDWPELYLIFNDEPALPWHVALAKKSAEIAHRYGLKSYCQSNGVTDREFLKLQDVHLYYPGYFTPIQTAERLHANKQKIWVLQFCMGVPTNTLREARSWFGFLAWKEKMDGVSTYAYQQHGASMRNALSPGHCHCAYFLDDDGKPMPTMAWETVREGVEDFLYAYTCERTIEKARVSGNKGAQALATEAAAALENLRQALVKNPDQPIGNYQAFRWHTAWWTLRLKAAIGEISEKELPTATAAEPCVGRMSVTVDTTKQSLRSLLGRVSVTCPSIAAAPVIDGALSDEAWKQAATATLRTLETGEGDPPRMTTVYLAHDDKRLYVAFRCLDPDMDRMKVLFTEGRDKPVWDEDCVELFVDPNHDHCTSYQWLVNPAGIMSDLRNTQEFTRGRWRIKGDSSWDSTAQVAAKRGEKEWTVEMAIPLSELGNPPTIGTWGLQAGREYGTKGDATRYRRFYAWAPTEGEFGKPENFGDLLFEDSPLAFTACEMSEPAVVGGNHVEFAVSSRDRKPHEVNVTAVVEMEDGKRRELKPLAVKIDAERGGAGELNVELDNPGRHVVTFLCEEKGKPPVLRLGTVVQTKPPLALSRDSIVLAEGRLSASISLAMGGVAMDRAIALSIVGPRWTMPLGRFQQISTLQKVDIGLAGLDAPPGNYLVRAEALKGDRIMARVEEPLFVDAPFME